VMMNQLASAMNWELDITEKKKEPIGLKDRIKGFLKV
jgi:hypothetical protein